MYRYDQNNLNSFYYDLRQLFSNLIFYTMYPLSPKLCALKLLFSFSFKFDVISESLEVNWLILG